MIEGFFLTSDLRLPTSIYAMIALTLTTDLKSRSLKQDVRSLKNPETIFC
jgi:hypothetical protein